MCEAVLSVERGRMHVGLLTVGVPYMHRMEPPIPKHLAEAPAELLTALTALTVPGALVASLPDDAWLGVGLGSVKPLGFGLGLGLGLRLGLGLGLGLDRFSWVVVGGGLDPGSCSGHSGPHYFACSQLLSAAYPLFLEQVLQQAVQKRASLQGRNVPF